MTIKSRDANFEKSNTSKCDLKPYLEWQTMFSKSCLLQMNVGESFPVCIDCSLPSHKEMMGMKVAMLASVHSSLQLVDLSWIFTIWIFLIKKIFLILFPLNIALRASLTLSAWNAKKTLGHGCFPLWMTLNHITSVMAGDLKFSANCFNKNARPYWQNLTGWCNHSL